MIWAVHIGVTIVAYFGLVALPLMICEWDLAGGLQAMFIRFLVIIGYLGYWIVYLALT